MDYVLFAFGDYTKEDPIIDLIVDFVSQISSNEVKFQYGDSGIIVSFKTIKTSDDIVEFFETHLTKLTAMFFVFPVTDNSIMSMDTEVYDHLFEKTDKKSDGPSFNFVSDMTDLPEFNEGDTTSLNKLFDLLFKPLEKKKKALTLDELLDKISETGISSLTNDEKNQLDEYAKK
jgi:hypothetical protein